jgi:hypothetical protein
LVLVSLLEKMENLVEKRINGHALQTIALEQSAFYTKRGALPRCSPLKSLPMTSKTDNSHQGHTGTLTWVEIAPFQYTKATTTTSTIMGFTFGTPTAAPPSSTGGGGGDTSSNNNGGSGDKSLITLQAIPLCSPEARFNRG